MIKFLVKSLTQLLNFLIRYFGLKGSFRWAIRKMKKGHTITRRGITGTLRFKLSVRGNLVWCFDSKKNQHIHHGSHRWDPAQIDINYISATDWCYLRENKDLIQKLEYVPKGPIN